MTLGIGYTSVSIANNTIYTTGTIDSTSYIYAFDMNGKLLWKKKYGYAWTVNFPGVRSTPLIQDGKGYLLSGLGKLVCFNIKNGEKGSQIFENSYSKNETNEIWVYGLDDKDVFNVTGVNNTIITIRIIGGQNNDTYNIENGKKVTLYDYKTKKNTFKTTKGKQKLFNNYDANSYNYKKLKYSQNQLIPAGRHND